MAWIELHQAIWTHRKSIMMATELDVTPADAVKHMAQLWCWALDNAPSGSLDGFPDALIAFGAGWRGDPGQFVEAARVAGFIDREPAALHDWNDYAGRLIAKRAANTERMRAARAPHVQNTCNARAGATVPNRTQPNPTKPRSKDIASVTYSSEFIQFWSAYPKKIGKGIAWAAWQKVRSPLPSIDELMNAIVKHKMSRQWQTEGGRFIPNPATWINQRRWEDEPEAKAATPSASHQEPDILNDIYGGVIPRA